MKKITRATVKSFIRRHRDHLFVMSISSFDGQEDARMAFDKPEFLSVEVWDVNNQRTLGVEGVYFRENTSFKAYSGHGFEGFEVSHSGADFVLAVRSEVLLAQQLGAKLPRASAAPSRSRL